MLDRRDYLLVNGAREGSLVSTFVSYARADAAFVEDLHDNLEVSGLKVVFDQEQPAGVAWWNQILAYIREANVVIFVISRSSVVSRACHSELEYARAMNRDVVPIQLDATSLDEIPTRVRELQIQDFQAPTPADWLGLASRIRQLDNRRPVPSPEPPAPPAPVADLAHAERKLLQDELNQIEQRELQAELESVAENVEDRSRAVGLMRQLRERGDVLAAIADQIDRYVQRVELTSSSSSPEIRRLVGDLKRGRCIPVVGAGVSSWLFGDRRDTAQKWASEYPFQTTPGPLDDLPQIAQFAAARWGDNVVRDDLREFYVRRISELIPEADATTERGLDELTVAAWENAGCNRRDLHHLLAQFPCPVYLTTEVSSLLTEALKLAGKDPRTAYFGRSTEFVADEDGEWIGDPYYRPTVDSPFVLHVFGSLADLDSIVITEDEYLDFLARVSRRDIGHVIPHFVTEAIAENSLLFTGFGLHDWSLRILLRSIIDRRRFNAGGDDGGGRRGNRLQHLATELPPTGQGTRSPALAKEYMVEYFGSHSPPIKIEWATLEQFAVDLAEAWEKYQ